LSVKSLVLREGLQIDHYKMVSFKGFLCLLALTLYT